jgi:hypothetical protein
MRDLDWEPKRARALGDSAVELWEEYLLRLEDLPGGLPRPSEAVALEFRLTR